MSHPDLEAIIEVPESAVPIYVQSGWQVLDKKASAALDEQTLADARAAEQAMAPALPPDQQPSAAEDTTKKENG